MIGVGTGLRWFEHIVERKNFADWVKLCMVMETGGTRQGMPKEDPVGLYQGRKEEF